MEGRKAPQGLDAEDRLALGLSASHLGYLVIGGLVAYVALNSTWPTWLRLPVALIGSLVGAALAWGQVQGRHLDTWLWLAARYYSRPRRSLDRAMEPRAAATPHRATTPRPPRTRALESKPARLPAPKPPPKKTVPKAPPKPASRADANPDTPILALPGAPALLLLHDGAAAATPYHASGEPEVETGTEPATIVQLPRAAATADEESAPPLPEPAGIGRLGAVASAPVFLSSTQRVAFFSLKGGAGKSTLATETAALLARTGLHRPSPAAPAERLRVALVDVNLSSANVSMRLGLTHPTLWDLVMDPDPGPEAIASTLLVHRESGLRVVLGPPRAVPGAEGRSLAMQRVAAVLSHLDDADFHFVFIDMSSEINDLSTYLLEACHQVFYVMTPTASGVQDTYRGVETLRRLGHRRKLRFVLNQDRGGFDAEEILGDLGGELAATVPRDDAFVRAEDSHRPACLGDRGAASRGIAELAAAIYPALDAGPARRRGWRILAGRG